MKRCRGFSLVEALVAIALILVAGMVILSAFPTARKGLQLSENTVNAAYLGKSLLDDERRKGFDLLAATSGSYTYSGTNNGVTISQPFAYAVHVETIDTNKKRIWAEITWKEATGARKVVLETLMTRY